MTGVQVVTRRYFKAFSKDKGKILHCILIPLCAGVLVPFLYKSPSMQMLTIIGISIIYLTQTISGVFAQEKEKRTLETLLSTPLSIKALLFGATLYNMSIVLTLSLAILLLQALTNGLLGSVAAWSTTQLALLIIGWLITLVFITVSGLLISILSDNVQTASQRTATRGYTALLFLSACLTLRSTGYTDIYCYFMLLYIAVLSVLIICKLFAINSLSIERVLMGVPSKAHNTQRAQQRQVDRDFGVFSQIACMLRHEWKIAKTYKSLWGQIILMMFLPGIAVLAFYVQDGILDFKLPIIVAILLAARIPMNLISITIGGEKVHKTFESLLSTPVSTRSMFAGKMLLSVIVSGLVLVFSSVSILLAANGINRYAMEDYSTIGLATSEWVLLLGGGFMVAVLMIFISGYSALMSKAPRAGLWVSLFASLAIAVPHFAIFFYVESQLPVSIGYTVLLLVINACCFKLALGKVDRRVLLSRI